MYKFSEIPFELFSEKLPGWTYDSANGTLSARALAKSDFYRNPAGDYESDAEASLNALWLSGNPGNTDFQFSSKVTVDFDSDYDAGVLSIWSDGKTWAKLCFELSPDKEFMVVSVVTQGASDDVNSFTVPVKHVWLRVSRTGHLYAFHASTDGKVWKLIRAFTLGKDTSEHRVGFLVQAPIGEGCDVIFEDFKFLPVALGNLRDGS